MTRKGQDNKSINCLFVYGTLKRGQVNGELLAPVCEKVELASTEGRLVDLGLFPGMVPGNGRVHGELLFFPLNHMATVLAVADHLEGCDPDDPAASLFYRERVIVTTTDGNVLESFAYFYNQSHPDALGDDEAVMLATETWEKPARCVKSSNLGFERFTQHVYCAHRDDPDGKGK